MKKKINVYGDKILLKGAPTVPIRQRKNNADVAKAKAEDKAVSKFLDEYGKHSSEIVAIAYAIIDFDKYCKLEADRLSGKKVEKFYTIEEFRGVGDFNIRKLSELVGRNAIKLMQICNQPT